MAEIESKSKAITTHKDSSAELLRQIISAFNEGEEFYSRLGIVKSVDEIEKTASVQVVNGDIITDVRLQQVASGEGLFLKPSIDSAVLIGWSDKTTAYISLYSQIDEIVFKNGTFGGLIKIDELTAKLNDLVSSVNSMYSEFKAHTHNVTAIGSPTGPVIPVPLEPNATSFNSDDYENKKFKH